MTVRLPRLLDSDYNEVRRLQPLTESASIPLRETPTATMTLAGEEVAMHDWVELFTVRGSIGIFRVTDIDTSPRQKTTANLRHAIDSLSDDVWADQLDFDGTVDEYLADLLDQQTVVRWQLGECDDTSDWKKSGINYTRLSELLWGLADERRDYRFVYDFTTSPWTLSFKALPATVGAEVRLSRNAESVQIRRTDSDMCNKLHVSVTTGTNITIKHYDNTASQTLYGVIVKTADINSEDVPDADTWAAEFLARRASPAVQVTISGYELSRLTGETFDEMDVGKKCRVALPAIPEVLDETIVTVTYPDVYGTPERVTVELNNHLEKFSESIANLKKRAGGGGGGGGGGGRLATAEDLKYWAKIVSNQDAIIEGSDLKALVETGIVLEPGGARIFSLIEGMQANRSEIDVNASNISLVVTNGSVRGDVIVGIVNGSSQVDINADYIKLNGQTSVSSLLSGLAIISAMGVTDLSATNLTALQTFTYQQTQMYSRALKLGTIQSATALAAGGTSDVDFDHAHALSMDSSGHVTAGAAVAVGDSSATFDVAATAWYQQQIAAARQDGASGVTLSQDGWDRSGNNIVRASNGACETVALPTFSTSGGTTWSSGVTYVYFSTPSVSLPLATKQVSLPSTSNWSAAGSVSPPSSAGSITVSVGGLSRTFTWNGSSWS